MVPQQLVVLDALPLTPNGKIDRAALPTPGRHRPEVGAEYVAPRDELELFLAAEWAEILSLDRVGIHDGFFELGGTSLQAAEFVNGLQGQLGAFINVTTVFEAPTVARYAALVKRDYPAELANRFGAVASGVAVPQAKLGRDAIARMESCIPRHLETVTRDSGEKNPPAIFVLAPPRSGTTLLRVMLAGHPELFAASELQLLGFESLRERRRAYSGKFAVWLEGTVRAVMELKTCGVEQARAVMERCEAEDYSTKEFYRLLQEWVAGRLLVDKSPSYALDPATLEKAEGNFDGALYIHLLRHPYAMVRSFEAYRVHQVLYLKQHPFSPRQLGELIWSMSHRNILNFLRTVPADRQFRIGFEDLVREPKAVMEGLCDRFGLEFHGGLLEPYADLDRKMTDGIHHASTPMGDTKFLSRGAIDPSIADAWRGVRDDDFLADFTWELAESLGYDRRASVPEADRSAGTMRRVRDRRAALASQLARRAAQPGTSGDRADA
jgi:hypothetical protein